jgi:hypothetical protein
MLPIIQDTPCGTGQNQRMSEIYTTWGHAKLLQHTDVLFSMQKERRFKPIQLQLCPTELCESDCPFCAVGYRPYKSSMPWEKLKSCILNFKKLGIKSLEITGGGNPLLYRSEGKNINDIIAFAADLDLDIGLITNAHKLGSIERSLYEKISWLRVSLIKLDEGMEPENYDFADFPQSKLGFSYIVYDKSEGCRTKSKYEGTTEKTFESIARLLKMYPSVKFVRIAGNSLISGYNQQTKDKYLNLIQNLDSKFFVKDIGEKDFPFDAGCYVGMIRPYVAPSPNGDGSYQVYICNSHVLFSNQTYDLDYSLCEVDDICSAYEKLNQNFEKNGFPYEVRGNKGANWASTCKLCFYNPNNELLHAVCTEIPDKNFP